MSFAAPLRFAPWLRPMPWGGNALAPLLHLSQTEEPIGEAWLLSDHPLHRSVVVDGPFAGKSLRELIQIDSKELLGEDYEQFPLLIKILDARENLSVQVHPDDQSAQRWKPHEGGKTEAWTVLASDTPGAIYLGLKRGIDKATFERELLSGNAVSCLQRYQPRPGETYYVPAGTVHALGQGVMVLEVQQTSDATFRLYDWGRVGPDGKARELHLEAGLACTKENVPAAGLQRPVNGADGSQILVRSPYFSVKRLNEDCVVHVKAPALLFLWKGSIEIDDQGEFSEGQMILIPHCLGEVSVLVEFETTLFEIRWN